MENFIEAFNEAKNNSEDKKAASKYLLSKKEYKLAKDILEFLKDYDISVLEDLIEINDGDYGIVNKWYFKEEPFIAAVKMLKGK